MCTKPRIMECIKGTFTKINDMEKEHRSMREDFSTILTDDNTTRVEIMTDRSISFVIFCVL